MCGECACVRAEEVYCGECARLLDRPASARPKLALALAAAPLPLVLLLTWGAGVLGLAAGCVLGALGLCAALVLSLKERAARHQGSSPRKGAAYPLAWAALALDFLLMAAGFLAGLLAGRSS